MLISLTARGNDAADVSFLLHKHPDRFQSFDMSYGTCHAFYSQADPNRCTFCLVLDVDPVQMTKGKKRQNKFALAGYVNDRPFVASSFLSSAISQVLGSALSGKCKQRPELTTKAFDFEIEIDVLPVLGGEEMLRRVFEPLGYEIEAEQFTLDPQFPEWGASRYFSVCLRNRLLLSELLSHLYVLIPVFDNQKHYFVGPDELEKLMSKGKGWLQTHPEKETIARRYLKFQKGLFHQAMQQLEVDEEQSAATPSSSTASLEAELEKKISLNQQRLQAVKTQLLNSAATRVIDLGCGEGKLLRSLKTEWQFKEVIGVDVSMKALEIAKRRLRMEEMPSFQADRIKLMHGSLMYRDGRFEGFDAAAIVEVIEHLDPPRLSAFEKVVFRHARPRTVIITTPNAEYNVMWESLPAGKFRHSDHRFEWTRSEFQNWANAIASEYGYRVEFLPVGPVDETVGSPTQMGLFKIGVPSQANATEEVV